MANRKWQTGHDIHAMPLYKPQKCQNVSGGGSGTASVGVGCKELTLSKHCQIRGAWERAAQVTDCKGQSRTFRRQGVLALCQGLTQDRNRPMSYSELVRTCRGVAAPCSASGQLANTASGTPLTTFIWSVLRLADAMSMFCFCNGRANAQGQITCDLKPKFGLTAPPESHRVPSGCDLSLGYSQSRPVCPKHTVGREQDSENRRFSL